MGPFTKGPLVKGKNPRTFGLHIALPHWLSKISRYVCHYFSPKNPILYLDNYYITIIFKPNERYPIRLLKNIIVKI